MPEAQKSTVKRGKIPRGAIVSALRATGGMVTLAAQQLGCSHTVIYRRLDKDPILRQVLDEERDKALDIAEAALKRATLKGEAWAVCFTLKTIGKKRGYVERIENLTVDLTKLSEEQLERIRDGEEPSVVLTNPSGGGIGTETPSLASNRVN